MQQAAVDVVLAQVVLGAHADGLQTRLVVAGARQYDDCGARHEVHDRLQSLQRSGVRQVEIQQHDVMPALGQHVTGVSQAAAPIDLKLGLDAASQIPGDHDAIEVGILNEEYADSCS